MYVCVTALSDIACMLRAADDVQESDKVRSLLKDIREVRQAKSRDGLQNIDRSELAVRLSPVFPRHQLIMTEISS